MNKTALITTAFLFAITVSSFGGKADTLNGTWCVGEDGLVLTFSGKDSLQVSSQADESVNGSGTYVKSDTSFTATVLNGDVTMKMKYIYRWKGIDTVEARAELFMVNDETIDTPAEWMFMTRCTALGPSTPKSDPDKSPVSVGQKKGGKK